MRTESKLKYGATLSLIVLLVVCAEPLTGRWAAAKVRTQHPKARSAESAPLSADSKARQADDDAPVRGQRMTAATAVINFAELARADALKPDVPKGVHFVPEPREEDEEEATRARPLPAGSKVVTESAQAAEAPQPLGPSPTASPSFQGIQATGWYPPDTQGTAGPNHLMSAVNGGVLVQSKTGSSVGLLRSLSTFFSPVANGSGDVFDPRIQYDSVGGRWILVADADRDSAASAILVGVSQTSDPTGNWNLTRIDVDSANQSWADYPMLGFNKNWIVVSANMFANTGSGAPFYARLFVINKADFYAGVSATYTQFTANNVGGTLMPACTYDASPASLYLLQDWNGNSGGSGYLRLYNIAGAVGSEVLNGVSSAVFISTPNPWSDGGGNIAPQLGTSSKIQVNDASMQSVVYRNGSLWGAHSVFLPAGAATRSSIQWWQIEPTTPSVQQRGRIDDAGGSVYYGFPSIAVNGNSDVLIGYARFTASQYASAGYAYRAAADPANSMRDDTSLKVGAGTYTLVDGSGRNRWGDYSGAAVDPADNVSFWTLQEYAAATNAWGTWWGRVPPAVQPPPAPTAGAATNVTGSGFTANWGASSGATGYRLDVSTSNSFGSFVSGYQDLDVGNVLSRAVSGLSAGVTYYYRVRAYNSGGVSGNSGVISVTTTSTASLRIDSVSPKAARASGGQQVTLTGDFAGLSTVTVGGNSVSWSYTSGTSAVAFTTPAHGVGAVSIVLTPSSGSTLTKSNAFAYLPTVFTDNTLVAGVTRPNVQHITELRQAVDALRAVAGLGPAPWTDPVPVSFVTPIKAVHIQELRSYLEDAASRLGYAAGSYTDPGIGTGYIIRRVHMEELRQRIRNIAS